MYDGFSQLLFSDLGLCNAPEASDMRYQNARMIVWQGGIVHVLHRTHDNFRVSYCSEHCVWCVQGWRAARALAAPVALSTLHTPELCPWWVKSVLHCCLAPLAMSRPVVHASAWLPCSSLFCALLLSCCKTVQHSLELVANTARHCYH
jgi:hypothetical protein